MRYTTENTREIGIPDSMRTALQEGDIIQFANGYAFARLCYGCGRLLLEDLAPEESALADRLEARFSTGAAICASCALLRCFSSDADTVHQNGAQ